MATKRKTNYLVLTLEVITGVCYRTRQGRLQKTTTTTKYLKIIN